VLSISFSNVDLYGDAITKFNPVFDSEGLWVMPQSFLSPLSILNGMATLSYIGVIYKWLCPAFTTQKCTKYMHIGSV